ncbi:MAG: S49 family peptidase [Pirellulales bacterium]
MTIEALTFATSDLWCIAPAYANSAYRPGREPIPTKGKGDTVAVVELFGTLDKRAMVPIRERVAALAANEDVAEIVLLVDSPGGTVAGVHDLHTMIARAAEKKRVTAVVEDLCCSGAVWAVAGATEIVIGETSTMGSIGVFNVVIDQSKLMEKVGVEVIVIRSGEHKGAGVSGAKISAEQLTELKRRVDVQARHFTAAVARGRRMKIEKAAELADGRVFIGREAVAAGLADRVGMYEDVLSEAVKRTRPYAINRLTGAAALAKFDELVEEKAIGFVTPEAAAEQLRYQYPQLAAAAEKHRREGTLTKSSWRPGL